MSDEQANYAGEITKLDEEQRLAYGWASVVEKGGLPVVDKQGDIIRENVLQDAVHEFVMDVRTGKVMHEGDKVADLVESMVFTKDLQKALKIDLGQVGWFVGMKVHSKKAWDDLKSGKLKMFSIGGHGQRVKVED